MSAGGGSEKPGKPTRPSSNWWMLHRDLEHTSRVPSNGVTPLSKLWERTFADALSFTQPICGDDALLMGVVGNGTEAFVALNPETGNLLWTRTKAQNGNLSVSGTPVAVNGRVYFVEWFGTPGKPKLTCLKIADGSVIWSVSLPAGSQAGLAAAFGNIYLLTRDGVLRAHNAETGEEVWQAPGIDDGYGGQTLSSPAIGFGNVYVGSHQGLRVFDATTGAPKWYAINSPSNGNASPVIVMDVGVGNPAVVVIGTDDNVLRAYHATSGQPLWDYPGVGNCTTPATAGGKLYLAQGGAIIALDAVTGALLLTSPDLGGTVSSAGRAPPTIVMNRLITGTQDPDDPLFRRLIVLDLATLNVVEERNIPRLSPRPSVEDGRLFISGARSDSSLTYPPEDTVYAFHKGCLIATAAYGSPLAPQVAFLRDVRDKRLRRSRLGDWFINGLEWIYYKYSPQVSEAMCQHSLFRRTMRWLLVAPTVYILMVVAKPATLVIDRISRILDQKRQD